jgi:hypothetical protein
MWDVGNDLSRSMAEFNMCLASDHAAPTVVTVPYRVYSQIGND